MNHGEPSPTSRQHPPRFPFHLQRSSHLKLRPRSDDPTPRKQTHLHPTDGNSLPPPSSQHTPTMNPIPRFTQRIAAEASSSWFCFSCRRAGAQWQQQPSAAAGAAARSGSNRFFSRSFPRRQQQHQQHGQSQQRRIPDGAAPGMDKMNEVYKRRNRSTA